jgi:thymidine phosphorylase
LMSKVIHEGGVDCVGKLTGTNQPNGMSIGNSVEVAEATSIITGRVDQEYWDSRAVNEQREIVIDFFIIMLDRLFPGKTRLFWKKVATEKFENGEVQTHYEKILSAHKVSKPVINNLCQDPNFFIRDIRKYSIKSTKKGVLRKIDQKRLGYILNFNLGAGGNIYSKEMNYKCGLILKKRLGDYVSDSSELCIVLDNSQVIDTDLIKSIHECFSIA